MWVYIWTDEWMPWANTIAYYPLTSETTVNDLSWNGYNLTTNWTVTFWTNQGVSCASFNSSWLYISSFSQLQWTASRTYSFWIYDNNTWTWQPTYVFQWRTGNNNQMVLIFTDGNKNYTISQWGSSSGSFWAKKNGQWVHIAVTYDGSKFTWYTNWTSAGTWTYTINTQWSELAIWKNSWNTWGSFVWYISEVIVENKVRTASEIAGYYNQTKSQYWIS